MTAETSEGVWARLEDGRRTVWVANLLWPGDEATYRLAYAPRPDTQADAAALMEKVNAKLIELGLSAC